MLRQVGDYKVAAFYDVGQPYDWMANTYRGRPVNIDGQQWPSTEHYFQAQKYPGNTPAEIEYRRQIREYSGSVSQFPQFARGLISGGAAGVTQIPGLPPFDAARWDGAPPALDGRSHEVMRKAVKAKMEQHPDLAAQLDALPRDAMIVEATRNDSKWADGGDGSGTNHLGIIYKELQLERAGVPQAQARQEAADGFRAFNATRQGQSLYTFPQIPAPAVPGAAPAPAPAPAPGGGGAAGGAGGPAPAAPGGAGNPPAAAETEEQAEAKRVEAAKREQERKQYEARKFGELYSQYANWPRAGWKRIGGGKPDKDPTNPRLQSGGTKDLGFGEGFYEGTDKSGKKTDFNIYFDGKGTAIPQGKGKLTEEKHSATIDFLASTQGANTIVFDLDPSAVHDKQYKGQNIKLIEQHIKLCKEKGLSAEFGPQTMAFLQTLDKSEQDKYLKQLQELDVLRKEKDMLRGIDNTQRLFDATVDVGKPAVTGFDRTQPGQYTDRVVTEATGTDPDPQVQTDKQLAAVEAELDKVDKGIEQVDQLQARFDRDMDAQNSLLQEPEKLALAAESEFFAKRGKTETVKQMQQRYKDAENVVKDLQTQWNDPANKGLRERHLVALDSKSAQLQEIGAAWKTKLQAMQVQLQQAKTTAAADPAMAAKVAKIEAQIEKIGKNIERIDAAKAKIDAQKQQLLEMRAKHDGQAARLAEALTKLQERKQHAQPARR